MYLFLSLPYHQKTIFQWYFNFFCLIVRTNNCFFYITDTEFKNKCDFNPFFKRFILEFGFTVEVKLNV